MRTFSFHSLSTSTAIVLALAACNTPTSHPDAYVAPLVDMGMGSTDTNAMSPDTHTTGTDSGGTNTDGGASGMCRSVGGGCDLFAHACPTTPSRQGCYLVTVGYPDGGTGGTSTMCINAGSGQSGAQCQQATDCDDGLICIQDHGASMPGHCTPACCQASDCPTAGDLCNQIGGLPAGVTTGYCSHVTNCMPVPNTGCSGTDQCYVSGDVGQCQPSGTATEGMPCGGSTGMDCAVGLGCFGSGTAGSCQRWCRVAMGTTTNADCSGTAHTCTQFTNLGSTYGLCQ
jgi:hypothetical protein